jgi:GGDEF domain-containing protein
MLPVLEKEGKVARLAPLKERKRILRCKVAHSYNQYHFVPFEAFRKLVLRFLSIGSAIIMWAGNINMVTNSPQVSEDLERREFHLSIFAAFTIAVLTGGLALLMYPAVFSAPEGSETAKIAFYGFCALSCLLVAYIIDRQLTIHRLRVQLAIANRKASEAMRQASADLLSTMPNFNTFEDRLTMEFRRAAAADLKLTVMVVAIKLQGAFSGPDLNSSALGDAAKAILRKLREQDSIFIIRAAHFGVILPGLGQAGIPQVSKRIAEGLSDAAGANERFTFKIDTISYPEQTSSAQDMDLAVSGCLPENESIWNAPKSSQDTYETIKKS